MKHSAFAVGAWRVGPRVDMPDAEPTQRLRKELRNIGAAIVGHDKGDGDATVAEPSESADQKAHNCSAPLVRHHDIA